MLEDYWANAVFSVTPTIVIGLIFWLVIRSIFRLDRTERKVYSEIEDEERAKRGLAPRDPTAPRIAAELPNPTGTDGD